jgi:predicted nucleic-acid-binding protein
MTGLDTNVLVRILTADDEAQTAEAARFIGQQCSSMSPGFVSTIVLTELVWVLGGSYAYGRREITSAIETLLASRDLAVEAEDQVRAALRTFAKSSCDYIDALIGEINRARGCEATATFDRKAAKLDGFVLVA